MRHMKRQNTPKNWPIPRKGTKFVVRPNFGNEKGLPLLIVLRDVLKMAKTRKEVKKALHAKNILINGKVVKDEKNSLMLFDVMTIIPSNKNYRLELSENGKFKVEEIKSNEANKKVTKVIGKKTLKGKKFQLNFIDGRNLLSDIKCKVNDSVLIEFKNKKIAKCLELKEKANVVVIAGKHAGESGKIESIDDKTKMATINHEKNKTNILIKQLMVVE